MVVSAREHRVFLLYLSFISMLVNLSQECLDDNAKLFVDDTSRQHFRTFTVLNTELILEAGL